MVHSLLTHLIEYALGRLKEDDLLHLNRRIVERLRSDVARKQKRAMGELKLKDIVSFAYEGGTVEGTIVRFNRNTVTICTHDGRHWKVSPSLVQKRN